MCGASVVRVQLKGSVAVLRVRCKKELRDRVRIHARDDPEGREMAMLVIVAEAWFVGRGSYWWGASVIRSVGVR